MASALVVLRDCLVNALPVREDGDRIIFNNSVRQCSLMVRLLCRSLLIRLDLSEEARRVSPCVLLTGVRFKSAEFSCPDLFVVRVESMRFSLSLSLDALDL